MLLVESVDRLSRLSQADWDTLKGTIKAKGLRFVVADLPTRVLHSVKHLGRSTYFCQSSRRIKFELRLARGAEFGFQSVIKKPIQHCDVAMARD